MNVNEFICVILFKQITSKSAKCFYNIGETKMNVL